MQLCPEFSTNMKCEHDLILVSKESQTPGNTTHLFCVNYEPTAIYFLLLHHSALCCYRILGKLA